MPSSQSSQQQSAAAAPNSASPAANRPSGQSGHGPAPTAPSAPAPPPPPPPPPPLLSGLDVPPGRSPFVVAGAAAAAAAGAPLLPAGFVWHAPQFPVGHPSHTASFGIIPLPPPGEVLPWWIPGVLTPRVPGAPLPLLPACQAELAIFGRAVVGYNP